MTGPSHAWAMKSTASERKQYLSGSAPARRNRGRGARAPPDPAVSTGPAQCNGEHLSASSTYQGVTPSPAERNRDRQGAFSTYLITWVCYATWLPGESGAVPRSTNRFGSPLPEPDASRQQQSRDRMTQQPYRLDVVRRNIVLNTLHEVCSCRTWTLLAAHVRTSHVHAVITANRNPEHVMTALKAYSSRALNAHQLDDLGRCRWARHGSTRYLWTADAVRAAIQYVVREQGESMAVFEMPFPR
jgi:REP element-mobilizing transposase RayT